MQKKTLVNIAAFQEISKQLSEQNVTLVAVSKTKPIEDIQALYDLGQRDFGENYVQELIDKQAKLPADIRWHFIGHLQSNKVKYIAPFVYLIHSVDNEKLLWEINKQAVKNNRVIDCLLQMHIAEEETKFGLNNGELEQLISTISKEDFSIKNIRVKGLMGMASNTNDNDKIKTEFKYLKQQYDKLFPLSTDPIQPSTLSMGMSSDYKIAIEEGSNLVRIGSLLFGERKYSES